MDRIIEGVVEMRIEMSKKMAKLIMNNGIVGPRDMSRAFIKEVIILKLTPKGEKILTKKHTRNTG